MTDVRNKNDLSDYTGELQVDSSVRITDRNNGPACTAPATVEDMPLPVTVTCQRPRARRSAATAR